MSKIRTLAFALATVGFAAGMQAATITGTAYIVSSATAMNVPAPGSNIAALAGSTLVANFTLNSNVINFSDNFGANMTLPTFLNFGGNLASINYVNGGSSSTSINNLVIELTGSAFFKTGQTFTNSHDDGTILSVGGTVVQSQPGPSSISTTVYTYSGPTGTQNFDFTYGECCTLPAVWNTNLALGTAVPEPSSIVLLGSGLGLLGLIRRKRAAR